MKLPDTPVDLQGSAADFSLFNGRSGDCASVDDCAVVMDIDKYVTAEFKLDSTSDKNCSFWSTMRITLTGVTWLIK